MNWEAIGAVGEVVGAAGVIGSLVYLGGQIRRSTNAEAAKAFREIFDGWVVAIERFTDPEFVEFFRRGAIDYNGLDADERPNFHVTCVQILTRFSAGLEAERLGVMARGVFTEGVGRIVASMFLNPGVARFWESEKMNFPESLRRWEEQHRGAGSGAILDFSGGDYRK